MPSESCGGYSSGIKISATKSSLNCIVENRENIFGGTRFPGRSHDAVHCLTNNMTVANIEQVPKKKVFPSQKSFSY